jgi:hypothetical protein
MEVRPLEKQATLKVVASKGVGSPNLSTSAEDFKVTEEPELLRRDVYDFLTLPYSKRLRIVVDLNLVEEGDQHFPSLEFFKLCLNRAEGRGLMQELRLATRIQGRLTER